MTATTATRRRRRGWAAIATLGAVCLWGAMAWAAEPGPTLLRLKGKAGDTWQEEYETRSDIASPETGVRSSQYVLMRIERRIEAVRPAGRLVCADRVLRVRLQRQKNDEPMLDLDSADPRTLKSHPEFAAMVEQLRAPFRYEQEPTGEFRTAAGALERVGPDFEELVAQRVVLLPEKPVRELDTWAGAARRAPSIGLGEITLAEEMALLHVRDLQGERVAFLAIRDMPTFHADEESGAQVRLKEYKGGAVAILSLDRGRITQIDKTVESRFEITEQQHTFTLKSEAKLIMREVR
jgi:hypothetical protein